MGSGRDGSFPWPSRKAACYSRLSGAPMHMRVAKGPTLAPTRRWSRARARCICPRKHLRVLPTRTRPSLFGGD